MIQPIIIKDCFKIHCIHCVPRYHFSPFWYQICSDMRTCFCWRTRSKTPASADEAYKQLNSSYSLISWTCKFINYLDGTLMLEESYKFLFEYLQCRLFCYLSISIFSITSLFMSWLYMSWLSNLRIFIVPWLLKSFEVDAGVLLTEQFWYKHAHTHTLSLSLQSWNTFFLQTTGTT